MKVIGEGMGLVEGPVCCRDGSLIVTSLDQGKVFRIDERGVTALAETGGGANGAT